MQYQTASKWSLRKNVPKLQQLFSIVTHIVHGLEMASHVLRGRLMAMINRLLNREIEFNASS